MNKELRVQNRTEIASPIYADLVKKYRTFAKLTAENIIRLAETLCEAKRTLSKPEFHAFCKEIGLTHDGPKYKKLMKISAEASRFEQFFDRMPNNWTTVYKLAALDPNKFDVVTKDDRFTPTMIASEIDEILGRQSKKSELLSHDWTLDLSNFDRTKKIEVCKKVKELIDQYGFPFKVGTDLAKELTKGSAKPDLLKIIDLAA